MNDSIIRNLPQAKFEHLSSVTESDFTNHLNNMQKFNFVYVDAFAVSSSGRCSAIVRKINRKIVEKINIEG